MNSFKFSIFALLAGAVLIAAPGDADAATRKAKAKPKPAPRAVAQPAVQRPVVIPAHIATNLGQVAHDFDGWLDAVEQSGQVAGLAAAVIKDDKVLVERGIGYANWQTREPVGADTVFRLASLSKAFAAAMTGILVHDGRMSWNTNIVSMLPTFSLSDAGDSQKLTVRDVLSHRVGLPHNTYDTLLEQSEPYPLIVDKLKDVSMACPVGECYGYQNIAFSLIGDAVYATTGEFFYHLVEKRIFHPLGMSTATYGLAALESSKSWARPHARVGKSSWRPYEPNENYYRVAPAAGVNASIRDMEQWLIAQMGGRTDVFSPALLQELHAPVVRTEREMRSSPWRRGRLLEADYALGWRVYDYAGETLVFHGGAVKGYRAMIGFLPAHRFGVVMLWNSETALPSGLMPMLLDRYLGLPKVDWANVESIQTTPIAAGGD